MQLVFLPITGAVAGRFVVDRLRYRVCMWKRSYKSNEARKAKGESFSEKG
jgi:hypothetical protein